MNKKQIDDARVEITDILNPFKGINFEDNSKAMGDPRLHMKPRDLALVLVSQLQKRGFSIKKGS